MAIIMENKEKISKRNYVLQQIHEIYSKFSHLSRMDRILSYIDHFCKNFQYDTAAREEYLLGKNHFPETFTQNENLLFNLFKEKKGVCMQFAQALTLLSAVDNSITNDMPLFVYAAGLIQTKTQPKLGHSINLIFLGKKQPIAIDISSMIHARDGELSQDKMSFGMVYMDEYLNNLSKEGINFLMGESGLSLQCYRLENMTAEEMYDFLNTPPKKMTQKEKKKIFYFNLSK